MLVVDFMNVLARCFHVGGGQASEVHGVRGMLDSVRKVCQTLNPAVIVFAGEGGHGYRKAIHPDYKSSRDETPPELRSQIELAKQALDAIGWPLLTSPGAEADDVIATLVADLRDRADSVVVVSTDKDMLQLIGRGCQIYDPYKRKGFVQAQHVVERFGVQPSQIGDLLALAGDTSDDIPGVKGIGRKKAAGLLIEFGTLDRVLEEAKDWTEDKSAMRRTLAASIAAVRLSRRLVELQNNVPIVHGWEDWPADEPRNLWIDKLRSLGLGQAATRLGDWLKEPRRTEQPLTEATARVESAATTEAVKDSGVLRRAYDSGQREGESDPNTRAAAIRGQFGAGQNPGVYALAYWSGVKGEPYPFDETETPATERSLF